jgi:hypothetical protein
MGTVLGHYMVASDFLVVSARRDDRHALGRRSQS